MDEGRGSMTRKVAGTLYVVLLVVLLALIAIPWTINLIAELVDR